VTRRSLRWVLGVGVAFAPGCAPAPLPPLGSVELFIDTDAPVPPAPGVASTPNAPTPIFDTARIEIFLPGASTPCDTCSRDFDLDVALLQTGASMTVRSDSAAAGILARVRMFRSDSLVGGDPMPSGTAETVVGLPDQPATGTTEVTAFVGTSTVAFPVGTLSQPASPMPGPPDGTKVGTWAGAAVIGCAGSPGTGEVCIPGGAYWMGNVEVLGSVYGANLRRLVVLSPFFIDDHEATLAEFVAGGGNLVADTVTWSSAATPEELNYWCTPGQADMTLPINCVNYPAAEAYCKAKGGELPTEAQFEYVEGGLVGTRFVWGVDIPGCSDAVWGLGGAPNSFVESDPDQCLAGSTGMTLTSMGGLIPLPAADPAKLTSRALDHLDLPGGSIWDLSGNLSEYTRDGFEPQTGPCWTSATTNVFQDPVCPQQTSNANRPVTIRGGSWITSTSELVAAARYAADTNNGSGGLYGFLDVGIRCVRPAMPAQ
jgi:formylglycine-generating enzyme required for sulfatase activity